MNFLLLSLVSFPSSKAPNIAPPTPAPPPPTIDEAAKNQDQQDILRQRKGASANVLAGAAPAPPTTNIQKLLGT